MSHATAALPEVTAALARGVSALLTDYGFSPLMEAPLGNGRRADVMGLGPKGEIWIVETKSCLADFTADAKWDEYRAYCDAFYFGVTEEFPREVLPHDTGLIVADRFHGAIVRPAPSLTLAPARRRALILSFARLAAARLQRDPS